jgi:hypothetical protein
MKRAIVEINESVKVGKLKLQGALNACIFSCGFCRLFLLSGEITRHARSNGHFHVMRRASSHRHLDQRRAGGTKSWM